MKKNRNDFRRSNTICHHFFGWWFSSRPERGTTGSVSTQFRWLGPNDKIVIDGFDDPKVQGVACHISRAQTGGVKGELGVA